MQETKNTSGLRTWIELDKNALAHNYSQFKTLLDPSIKVMAVVKSNAYGHGLYDITPEMQKLGVDWFGVDSVTEGFRLREEGITIPILVLGYTLPELLEKAVENGLSITASSFDFLQECVSLKLSKKIKVHIKADTGLHRQGFFLDQIPEVISFLKSNKDIFEVQGLYTHFAKAKDLTSREYTGQQIKEFESWIREIKKAGFKPIVHAAATGGTLLYPESHFDMVRIGAGMYGVWPSKQDEGFIHPHIHFLPVLSWKTIITETKKIKKGSGIGYDLSETVSRDSIIAICPIGYWHGFPRSLSSVGEVIVGGKKAKIIGRVSMDMMIIDITDAPEARYRDEVTIIGKVGEEEITADEIAKKAGTTPYEILTRLNPLIKKIYV